MARRCEEWQCFTSELRSPSDFAVPVIRRGLSNIRQGGRPLGLWNVSSFRQCAPFSDTSRKHLAILGAMEYPIATSHGGRTLSFSVVRDQEAREANMNGTGCVSEAYKTAIEHGVEWLLSQQNEDGSFIRPEVQADVYHKAPYALSVTGHVTAANRLLNWIKANDLKTNGDLKHFDDGLGLYKTNWALQGAHRLGRFDLSYPVMRHVLKCQAPCGGFCQVEAGNPYIEPVCTAAAGISCLYTGHPGKAMKAAECLIGMVDQQPDEGRFYYWMTPEGELATPASPLEGNAPVVDCGKTQQPYYCPGIILLFLTKLHLAMECYGCLDAARQLFEFGLRCAEDRYRYPTAGKSAVGAAIYYTISGDERARDAAVDFADYLVNAQSAEGWWANPHDQGMVTKLDHTAEFIVWLSEIIMNLGGLK